MPANTTLYSRARYFYEMATYEKEAHEDRLKKDPNLRLTIGYAVGQALEMTMKQLLDDLTGSHEKIHNLGELLVTLEKKLNGKVPCRLSLVSTSRLKNIIGQILPNGRKYSNLAYGARYISDLKFSVNELEELFDLTEKVLLFYGSVEDEL